MCVPCVCPVGGYTFVRVWPESVLCVPPLVASMSTMCAPAWASVANACPVYAPCGCVSPHAFQ